MELQEQDQEAVKEVYTDIMEYFQQSSAARFFEEMERIRRAWEGFYLPGALGRSGTLVLGMIAMRERQGHSYTTVGQLARVLTFSLAGISQRVSILVDQGYLERVPSPSDRRVSCVRITPKGRAAVYETADCFRARIERVLDRLGHERAENLFSVMRELSDAIYDVRVQEEMESGVRK